mmetsp:Transcript_25965/g.75703  ORF Transcript_25965/g.75703 Transcript_25965/m.75703 type:complete len:259 (-) Transcript_25965:219-995(-)
MITSLEGRKCVGGNSTAGVHLEDLLMDGDSLGFPVHIIAVLPSRAGSLSPQLQRGCQVHQAPLIVWERRHQFPEAGHGCLWAVIQGDQVAEVAVRGRSQSRRRLQAGRLLVPKLGLHSLAELRESHAKIVVRTGHAVVELQCPAEGQSSSREVAEGIERNSKVVPMPGPRRQVGHGVAVRSNSVLHEAKLSLDVAKICPGEGVARQQGHSLFKVLQGLQRLAQTILEIPLLKSLFSGDSLGFTLEGITSSINVDVGVV